MGRKDDSWIVSSLTALNNSRKHDVLAKNGYSYEQKYFGEMSLQKHFKNHSYIKHSQRFAVAKDDLVEAFQILVRSTR